MRFMKREQEKYPDKIFIDSNILIYAHSEKDIEKNKKASKLLANFITFNKKIYVSNQIISEFIFVSVNKFDLDYQYIKEVVDDLTEIKSVKVVNYSLDTIKKAIQIADKHQIHYWDSLIVATMLENNIIKIYTENTKDFSKCDKITVENVFSEDKSNTID